MHKIQGNAHGNNGGRVTVTLVQSYSNVNYTCCGFTISSNEARSAESNAAWYPVSVSQFQYSAGTGESNRVATSILLIGY